MSRAKAAAERALTLDDSLAEAHTSLASVRHRYDWDWAGADASFRRALEFNPGYATAHQHRSLGVVHYHARRFDLAEAAERRSLELEPGSLGSSLVLAWSLIDQRKLQAAIDLCEQARSNHDEVLATLGYAYARLGQRKRADEIRQRLRARQPKATPASLVRLSIGLGDIDAAFQALERAFEDLPMLVGAVARVVDQAANRLADVGKAVRGCHLFSGTGPSRFRDRFG